jgi:hypothetical protein
VFARHALSPGKRDPDTKDVKGLVQSIGLEAATWSALGVEFDAFMRELPDDPDAAAMRFSRRALTVAREVFGRAVDRPDSTGRWLKARALAERSLIEHLPKVPSTAAPAVAEESHP